MSKKQTEKKTTPKKAEPKAKTSSPRKAAKVPAQAKKDTRGAVTTASVQAAASTAPAVPAAPTIPDPRLPAPGTLLQKKDRHGAVRCECTIEEGGIRYADKVYRSLSSAAMAAAKDLWLTNKTQNGFTFWGLSKPPRRPSDPLVALDNAWERYRSRTEAILRSTVTNENRVKMLATVRKHVDALEDLRQSIA